MTLQNLSDHDLLIRIDERTGQIEEHLKTLNGKIIAHDEELHKDGGVCDKLTTIEEKNKTNRSLIYAIWGVLAAVSAAVFDLFIGHLRG